MPGVGPFFGVRRRIPVNETLEKSSDSATGSKETKDLPYEVGYESSAIPEGFF